MGVIKYGIIGAGAIAQRRHLPEAHANPLSTVAAIADPVPGRAEAIAHHFNAQHYTDHRALLKDPALDAVVVCSPNKLHAPITIQALKAGKHVLCEKPMATTRADARKMIRAAAEHRRHLMVAMNQRFMPAHITAKRLLETGRLGKPLTFHSAFKHAGPEAWSVDGAKSWFFDADAASLGVTGDLAVHKVDLLRFLLGQEFTHVAANIDTLHKKGVDRKPLPLDDNALLNLRTDKQAMGTVAASWTTYAGEENDTVIYCTDGVLRIGQHPDYALVVEYANGDREMHKVGEIASQDHQPPSGVIDSFTECIRKNRKPEVDVVEGYRSLNTVLTAFDAARKNRTLPINHEIPNSRGKRRA